MARLISNKEKNPQPTQQKLHISFCVLAKNDGEYIEECLKSIQPYAREIIVLDLGSTDNTLQIVSKYTKRVFKTSFNYDYSEVRNLFFKYVSSDWVMYLDAHERLAPECKSVLNPKFLNKRNVAYMTKIVSMYDAKEVESFDCRLFRRTKDIRFKWVMQESVVDDVQTLAKRDNLKIVPSDLIINSYIYLKYPNESDLHKERVELAKKGLEKTNITTTVRTFYKLNLGLSLNALGETAEAEEKIREVLEELRLLDKSTVYSVPLFIQAYLFFAFRYSKLEDYDKALEILIEGVDIFNNSLTLLTHYCEVLYVQKKYKECLDHIAKIKLLRQEEDYYHLESINFSRIQIIISKVEKLAYDKYDALTTI